LVHLLVVPDGHARRMDEERHLVRLRPLPERKGGFAVDELTVPARRGQQPLEAEGTEATLALGDVTCVERIEGAKTPVALRARRHCGSLVVDVFDHVDRGLTRDRRDHLGRERIADDPPGDASLGADVLLQLEVSHVVIGHRGQTAIVCHRIFADRYPLQRLGNAEGIIAWPRRAVSMNIDDGHQILRTRP